MFATGLNYKQNSHTEAKTLCDFVTTSLVSQVKNLYSVIDDVVILQDGQSWRKEVEMILPDNYICESPQYKANRVKDDKFDWEYINNVSDRITDNFKKLGIKVIKSQGMEADDLIYIYSTILYNQNKKALLWGSDKDMKGFVKGNLVFYKKLKNQCDIFVSEELYDKYLGKTTFGNMFTSKDPYIEHLINITDSTTMVNDGLFLLDGIVKGQKKDNIHPLMCKPTKIRTSSPNKNHIKKALGEIGIEKVDKELLYNNEFITNFCSELLTITKNTQSLEHTLKLYEQNRKLMVIDKRELPEKYLKGTLADIKAVYSKPKVDLDTITKDNLMMDFENNKDSKLGGMMGF
jgi:DNA-dependent RNA polymerase auxiliary subunit epsilon